MEPKSEEFWDDLVTFLSTEGATSIPHAELYRLRQGAPKAVQKKLAPQEHRAFAREWTQENPLLAVPSLLAAIPLYSAAKASGVLKTRSPASIDEILLGYKGIWEGLTSGSADK